MNKKSQKEYEEMIENSKQEEYILKLYVSGMTPKSRKAVSNVKEICETHLKGSYTLKVIDLYQNPKLAKGEQIVAMPTLIKKLPPPLRKIIGDMSDKDKLLVGLDLVKINEEEKD
ncbi:MAG TPA: circadian clock protein KaiB [bacterium]|nr:circadian clock protein KaiB [bacterium]